MDARGVPEVTEVVRRDLREQCLQAIRALIVSGRLVAGELHSIGSVAEHLGVSVTPVREALRDLVREDLVEIVRNRGFRVVTLSDRDLDELVEMRVLLEVPIVKRLADARTDVSALRPLAEATTECAVDGDIVGFLSRDRELHLQLLSMADNGRLVKVVGELRDQTRLYGLDRIVGSQAFLESAEEHDQILDLVQSGESEAAGALMERHLTHTRGLWAGTSADHAAATKPA